MKFDMVMEVRCGQTVIMNGKRYRVTTVGVRGCEGTKHHANAPVEYFIASEGKELIAVLKQRGRE
jgi:hypothetical protein